LNGDVFSENRHPVDDPVCVYDGYQSMAKVEAAPLILANQGRALLHGFAHHGAASGGSGLIKKRIDIQANQLRQAQPEVSVGCDVGAQNLPLQINEQRDAGCGINQGLERLISGRQSWQLSLHIRSQRNDVIHAWILAVFAFQWRNALTPFMRRQVVPLAQRYAEPGIGGRLVALLGSRAVRQSAKVV
jgi:hypothetical protein